MNEPFAPVSFHMAQSVFLALQSMGKKDLSKKARAVSFQLFADEKLIRYAYEEMKKLGATPEQLKPLAMRVEREES